MKVVVRADTIYAITPLSHTAIDTLWGVTVDRLFELTQLDTTRWIVQAEFDQIYGFPKAISYNSKPPLNIEGGIAYFSFDFVH